MIKIHPQDHEPLIAFKAMSGVKNNIPWEWIKVKGMGKDKTTAHLWVKDPPSGIKEGDYFYVKEILDSTIKFDKDRKTGEWYKWPSTYYTVRVEKATGIPKGYKPEPWSEERKETAREEQRAFYEIHEDDDGLPF